MAKSKLKAIDPKEAAPSKPKIIIYGKPGVGKTWASLDFPNVYYIDTEGGADLNHYTDKLKKANGAYFGIDQGALSFENVIEQVQALATEKHRFKTLVIDSISTIAAIETTKEAEKLGAANAYGADKKPAAAYQRRLINWLKRIDMTVILIAHEKSEWGLVNGQRAEIGSTFDAYEKLGHELHLALNIVKASDKRIARVKKTRLTGFPDGESFSWSYKDFAERYGKDVIEKDSTQLILATEEQLAAIEKLLKKAILPEGIQDKWFTAANVSKYSEMDSDKIQKIIELINDKYLPKTGE